ncbi:YwiC-like protein [Bifidobacterium sp. DSM 109959]|uniref:YwiC-like protein n=2 Tax=Bifidobacterium olomucense TaxID=2675324 RepID=A0A7Y0EXC6_9BIFI|nr:YwiC-like protein [Bifidobacterium sp. DSM 109959]
MALTPALAGMIIDGTNPTTIWLFAAWVLCYCVQFTAARWFKSRFAHRYAPPVAVYTVLLAAVGLPFVIIHPTTLWWAPLYAILATLSFVAAWLRRERTLWGNAVAILASCTMAIVVSSFGTHAANAQYPMLANGGLPAATVFFLTQFGSVLFVKTMIRERGKRGYLWASWIWHGALLAAAFGLWGLLGFGRLFSMPAIVCLWLLARAIAMPPIARRRSIKPIAVGLVEMMSSLSVFAAVLLTF